MEAILTPHLVTPPALPLRPRGVTCPRCGVQDCINYEDARTHARIVSCGRCCYHAPYKAMPDPIPAPPAQDPTTSQPIDPPQGPEPVDPPAAPKPSGEPEIASCYGVLTRKGQSER